jgi:hypothetical protein
VGSNTPAHPLGHSVEQSLGARMRLWQLRNANVAYYAQGYTDLVVQAHTGQWVMMALTKYGICF